MRWLCDEMLGRLARLLRAAGHDTALASPGQPDTDLLREALAQERRLLTRDRALAARAGEGGLLLRADQLTDQAREVARAAPADWRTRRFTRCLMDNAELRDASPAEIARMPAASQVRGGPFCACPVCGRLYWPGSHVRRLAATLDDLAAQAQP